MANSKECVIKICERCGGKTRGVWRYRNFFYCYNCYKKRLKEKHYKMLNSQNK